MRRNRVTEHNFPIQDQSQRCRWLLDFLIREEPRYSGFRIPNDQTGQERLLHDLLAVRPAGDPGEEFLRVQDAYLQNRFAEIGTPALEPVSQGPMICLRRGDIASFPCGAVVNSSNGDLTGCRSLRALSVDTALQTGAGVGLRLACRDAVERHGGQVPPGEAVITEAYNLPCRYVIHTVAPAVRGGVPSEEEREDLARCYRAAWSWRRLTAFPAWPSPASPPGINGSPMWRPGRLPCPQCWSSCAPPASCGRWCLMSIRNTILRFTGNCF